MALTKMTDDLDIVAQLDDEPNDVGGLSPAEFKAKFDEGPNAIKDYINDTLTDELDPYLHTHGNKAALDTVPTGGVVTTLGGDDTTVPTSKAVSDAIALTGNLPAGGFSHQVLAKASETGYDTTWETPASENVSYDNTDSGLTAETVKAAIDEVVSEKQDAITVTGVVKSDGAGTLSAAEQGTDFYAPGGDDVALADGGTGAGTAAEAVYNLVNGLSAITPASADKLPFLDDSGATAGYMTLSTLLGLSAKIASGSYVGDGTYGSLHPKTLSFAFAPKLVFIFTATPTLGRDTDEGTDTDGVYWSSKFIILLNPATSTQVRAPGDGVNNVYQKTLTTTWGSDSVSWYTSDYATHMYNINGTTYYYIAIG